MIVACKSERNLCTRTPMQTGSTRKTGNGRRTEPPTLVVVEPVQIPIEGIFPARALTHIEPSARQSSQVTSQASPDAIRRADRAYVMLANFWRGNVNSTQNNSARDC